MRFCIVAIAMPRTRSGPVAHEPVPEPVADIIKRVMDVLSTAVTCEGPLLLTKHNVRQEAFPMTLFQEYRRHEGKVGAYSDLDRHFTQVIAL